MKMIHAIILLLCLGLSACADRNPGIALGVGSHGAGVALFTDSSWMGFGPCGGVMMGFGSGGYDDGRTYSSGRIVRREPAKNLPAGSSGPVWRREYGYPSLLTAYRELY